jgi:hypothetical protein
MIKSKYIKESIFDPIHETLNKNIWDGNNKLIPEVKNEIIEIVTKWLSEVLPGVQIQNLFFLGSNTGYQYSSTADIDINVQIDVPDQKIWDLFSILPNGNLLSGTQHPINYYLINKLTNISKVRGAFYNMLTDEWLIEPFKEDVEISFLYIIELAKGFMLWADNVIGELERDLKELDMYKSYVEFGKHKLEDLQKEIDRKYREIDADYDSIKVIANFIHSFRVEGFEEDEESSFIMKDQKGNFSINNQVYKILDKFGYLEKLQKYKVQRKQYIASKE